MEPMGGLSGGTCARRRGLGAGSGRPQPRPAISTSALAQTLSPRPRTPASPTAALTGVSAAASGRARVGAGPGRGGSPGDPGSRGSGPGSGVRGRHGPGLVEGYVAWVGAGVWGSARAEVGVVGAGGQGGRSLRRLRSERARSGSRLRLRGSGPGPECRGRWVFETRPWRHRAGSPGGSPRGHLDQNRGDQPPCLSLEKPEFLSGVLPSRPGRPPTPRGLGLWADRSPRRAARGGGLLRENGMGADSSSWAPARGQPLSLPATSTERASRVGFGLGLRSRLDSCR